MLGWKQGSFTTTSYYVCTQYTQELSNKGICHLRGLVMLQQLCGHLKTQFEGGSGGGGDSADQKPVSTPQAPCSPQLHSISLSPAKMFLSSRKTSLLTSGGAGCRCRMQVWIIQRQQTLPSFFCLQNCLNSVRQTVSIASSWMTDLFPGTWLVEQISARYLAG